MGGKIHFRIGKNLEKRIRQASRITFFFDYDGTLVSIRRKPSLAKFPKSSKKRLENLSKKKWARVFIVTGRTLENITSLIRSKSMSYVGNHGFELKHPTLKFSNRSAERSKKAIAPIYKELKSSLGSIKGVILENKYYTLSVHYRLVKKRYVEILKDRLYNITSPYKKKGSIRVTEGKKVFEIRPNLKWNKGLMVNWLMKKLGKAPRNFPIYIGDDTTDEDAFSALGKKGMTILVADKRKPTKARFRVKAPRDVYRFIKHIVYLKEESND